MNKTISTRVGIITGFLILAVNLFLVKSGVSENSYLSLLQFLVLFVGVLTSCFLLYKYYADIRFMDAFSHCIKTVATVATIVLLGNVLLFFLLREKGVPASQVNWILMKTIFAYSAGGLMASLFSSLIFNTFTKK